MPFWRPRAGSTGWRLSPRTSCSKAVARERASTRAPSAIPSCRTASPRPSGPAREGYASALAELSRHLDAPFFSDHLCYSSLAGHELFDLLPLPFTELAADRAAANARALSETVGRPLLLENITYYATMPGSEMTEGAFVARVLEASGAGLLLDVNNVYVNARNHGEDPLSLLLSLPLHRVRQIHLAGFTVDGDVYLDTHSSAVAEPVWALYREALIRVGPVPTLIEWDQKIPSLDRVLDEADRARELLSAARAPDAATANAEVPS
jgi:uncharacterized protein (UPF0276 family)